MTEGLKACPFCGGEPTEDHIPAHEHHIVGFPGYPGSWSVECHACEFRIFSHKSRIEAIAAWNRRAPAEAGALSDDAFNTAWDAVDWDVWRKRPVRELVRHLMLAAAPAAPRATAFQPAGGALPEGMSARQAAVLTLVRQGKSNKCIARELEIAESTVKCHVAVVMRKLGARNRTEVAVKAASRGCA